MPQTLRQVLRPILSEDLESYEIRARLNDWLNDVEEDLDRIVETARSVQSKRPAESYADSARAMAESAIRIL